MILPELTGCIAERFEELGNGRVFSLQTDGRGGHADLREPRTVHALAGDEGRAPGRATLFAIGIGEPHAFFSETIDVGRAISHEPVAVTAQVRDSDVVAPDDEDVRFVGLWHQRAPLRSLTVCRGL
jgi:hypothetical protein